IEEIIDARTSDAVALAIRFDAPIFTYKNILYKSGIYLKINSLETENSDDPLELSADDFITDTTESYASHKLEELRKMLKAAVNNEDYEAAIKIRDEISKREAL